ncbi:pre-rRNA processing protein FTSJ3 [Willisornis vidua]|uniref:pre-rRNA processing protein FTSJ3 n=1 Tax=Willisornis vidua TaxID=1566151 RepID=A0ABQ9DSB5_9PASS|nr:pre-rRNA processing protein FTSJ3 [Willisornis vidua]
MGKKSKLGKSRRDKFYHLAKETGFRSRSSFKLLQLNRKFQFLQKARALLDLCAAPGGWLQVASKFMPVSSLIIGVDLVPIKPIPNVVTLQEDITTEKCRQGRSHPRSLFSPAPANLTLMALKLACEFLCKGGWFITKVFRSRDYQPLLWIFQQFFQKVQATKPQASRNESAEIFVVCQGYQAPDKIDSKFFDPKYAFKEVEVQTKSVSELVSKKKPKAEGYADGDTTLYHRFTLMDFLKAPNPVDFLSKANEITLGNGELENHSSTTEELRQCCKDIRVLGRKELRALLNWRTKLRRFLAKKLKEQAKELDINLSSGEEEEGREEERKEKKMAPKAEAGEVEKEEEEVELALAEMKAKELAELKRKKKKILKEQRKQRERVELKMDLPGVSIADDGDTSMFSLRSIHRTPLLDELSRGDMASADALLEMGPGDDDIYVSDQEEGDDVSLASDLDPEELLEIEARQRKLERERREQGGKRAKFKQKKEEEEEGEEEENPLLVPLEEKAVLEERQTSLWFGKDAFAGIEDDADEDLELGQAQMLAERQRETQRDKATKKGQNKKEPAQEEAPAEPPPATDPAPDPGKAQDEQSSDDDSSSDDERPLTPVVRKRGRVEPCGFEVVPIENPVKRARVLDAEGLALGSVIATSKKARRDLIDDSFNRYSYNEDEGELPEWFTEEEKQHRRKQVPVDRQTVEAYRQRWREINARPIKKVAEAKARKKRRMLKKMEQMKKKAEAVVSTVDISEREKVAQLRRIYKKAGLAKEKRQVTYLVAKKGVGPRVRRPPGVKGQFKVVDSRLKKDVRAQKRKEQKKKRHK